MASYSIQRPPLSKDFHLPPQKSLLELKQGNLVKVMFSIDGGITERMWVKIIDQQSDSEWIGELDNDPAGDKLVECLKAGDRIAFHPLDIIQIFG